MNLVPGSICVDEALAKHTCLTISDSPHLDCQILLALILKQSRTCLFGHPEYALTVDESAQYERLVRSRAAGKPIAYITGCQEFWSRDFKVSEATLIPRPETELLVETILTRYPEPDNTTIIDLGTGAGPIAISLAAERPDFTLYATDKSRKALQIARCNSKRHHCNAIHFIQCDWLNCFSDAQFDVIVCNPPYVDPADEHLPSLSYEPALALVAASHGLSDLKKIISTARRCLKPGGMVLLEHGNDQQTEVAGMLKAHHFTRIEPLSDLAGQPRAVLAYQDTDRKHQLNER